MTSEELRELKYPIGGVSYPDEYPMEQLSLWTKDIEQFPRELEELVIGLGPELEWRYRPEGWTVRQVVHHCADSHMNAFIRFKLALTEDKPEVKPYNEAAVARMPDASTADVSSSIEILKGLHYRWTTMLKNLSSKDWDRTYYHSEYKREYRLKEVLALYSWHCKHHSSHIIQAVNSEGKYN